MSWPLPAQIEKHRDEMLPVLISMGSESICSSPVPSMKRNAFWLLLAVSFAIAATLSASPTRSHKRASSKAVKHRGGQNAAPSALIQSANGWVYLNGEWAHPDGYKFINGKVLRTTAKAGKPAPEPPGKLALSSSQKLAPRGNSAADNAKSAAEKSAEVRRKNLTPTAAPQTGTHL